jgi:hypothetical protein
MARKASTANGAMTLESIPNIGSSIAADLHLIGINSPAELIGQEPYKLYKDLCKVTGQRQDPCVLDTFIAATRFMSGEPPKPWWHYTEERKARFSLAAGGIDLEY